MKAGVHLAVALFAPLTALLGEPVAAQADAHARALARAACQNGKQAEAVTDASAAQEREPNELGPRLRLADALVDQGCYQEAVEVLEASQQAFPRNRELSGKLRDVRSLVTEQTYIEGLTQAAEGAKFQRNQLRCTRLADATACDDALKFKPDDQQLLLAKGDALMQSNRPADAAATYRDAAQLKPADEAVKTKLAAAEALVASTTQPTESPPQLAAAQPAPALTKPPKRTPVARSAPPAPGKNTAAGSVPTLAAADTLTAPPPGAQLPGGQHLTTAPLATVAALEPQPPRTYSNEAPPGRTN
jgi:predicted Zn-dependent protease